MPFCECVLPHSDSGITGLSSFPEFFLLSGGRYHPAIFVRSFSACYKFYKSEMCFCPGKIETYSQVNFFW